MDSLCLCRWLKAFKCSMSKAVFPYTYMTSLDRLDDTELPEIDFFHNRLKGEKMSDEGYRELQVMWEENGFRSIRDYLLFYMHRDTAPALEALQKMALFWRQYGICMSKVSHSQWNCLGIASSLVHIASSMSCIASSVFV